MNWATKKKCKVHKITPKVAGILCMSWCNNHRTVARIIGCNEKYVREVRQLTKSSAHVFLSPETLRGIR